MPSTSDPSADGKELVGAKKTEAPSSGRLSGGFLELLDEGMYRTGLLMEETTEKLRSRLLHKCGQLKTTVLRLPSLAASTAGWAAHTVWGALTRPFLRLQDWGKLFDWRIRQAAKQGRMAACKEFFRVLGHFLVGCKGGCKTLANYLLPVAGVVMLAVVVQQTLGTEYLLEVNYGGEVIGYIREEAQFTEAEHQLQDMIVYEEGEEPIVVVPEFTLRAVSDEVQLTPVEDICDALVLASGTEITEAQGFYIDGEFWGAVEDGSSIQATLTSLLLPYKQQMIEEGIDAEVNFVRDVELTDERLYPVTCLVDPQEIIDTITSEVEEEQIYIAVAGDSVSLIADKVDVPTPTLMALNEGIEDRLMIGDEVIINARKPYLEVSATYTGVRTTEIDFEVEQVQDSSKSAGYYAVAREGQKGSARETVKYTLLNGVTTEEVLDSQVLTEPVSQRIVVGTKAPSGTTATALAASRGTGIGSGTFMWPTAAGSITCGWLGYQGHYAIDIASKAGTAIYAADDGTVITARSITGGYGRYIIIDHGNGFRTLYAHNSELLVQVGQRVVKGQQIARMGQTGNATGNHLHFEVIRNGTKVNPLNYL